MDNSQRASYASIDQAMQDAAKFAVADAASEGLELDYSWDSVARLEEEIDRLFREQDVGFLGRLTGKKAGSGRRAERYSMAYGAYIAEVIRKRYPGSWSTDSKLHPDSKMLTFCTETGIEMWPQERIMKRVHNGAEDNVFHYISALEEHIERKRGV